MKLPTDPIAYRFDHAGVQFSNERNKAIKKNLPRLYVWAVDQYGTERKFTVSYRNQPGDPRHMFWQYDVTQPNRRTFHVAHRKFAAPFVVEFLALCRKKPKWLFNDPEIRGKKLHRARYHRLINLIERLHAGDKLTPDLLKEEQPCQSKSTTRSGSTARPIRRRRTT